MTNPTRIELYFGYVENTDGIHHAFEVVDPKACVDDGDMAKKLAKTLNTTPDDATFNYNSMYLDIPASVIDRIKNTKEAPSV